MLAVQQEEQAAAPGGEKQAQPQAQQAQQPDHGAQGQVL
jgi:hypothetical protein